jgi:glutamyl-tRNA reductase
MNLSDADRDRVEKVTRAVAQRMLHEPTLKLKEMAGTEAAYEAVNTVRELFRLDVETDPGGGSDATVTPIRREA